MYFQLENNNKRQLTYSVTGSKVFNYHKFEISLFTQMVKHFLKVSVTYDRKAVSMDAHMILVFGNQANQSEDKVTMKHS